MKPGTKLAVEILMAFSATVALGAPALAQGTRKDDIVFAPGGKPLPGATVRVCNMPATGQPCTPLANIFSDSALTQPLANPTSTDGLGNFFFYAAAGRYMVELSGSGITTKQIPDVILPNDPSSPTFSTITSSGGISAFTLSLGGNLTVSGNASVTGSLSTGSFNPSTISTTTLTVSGNSTHNGNACFKGPVPYVDVTCYGAKGDGTTDDTAAIQAAITAACASTAAGGGTVFFPPTLGSGSKIYKILQPQTPSTSSVFTVTCSALHLLGGNSIGGVGGQFNRGPQTRIEVTAGASPNAAPIFSLSGSANQGFTCQNLSLKGYNQVFSAINTQLISFKNCALITPVATGLADNVPLKLSNLFWFYFDEGTLQSATGSLPVALLTGESPVGGEAPLVGLAYFTNGVYTGAGFKYDQRVNTVGSGPGNIVFRNITIESSALDFLTVTNSTGNHGGTAMPQFTSVTFDHASQSDATVNALALINFNSSNSALSGVNIIDSSAGNAGQGRAITMTAGSLTGCNIFGGQSQSVRTVLDGSGNPAGSCAIESVNGVDYVQDTSQPSRQRTDFLSNSTPSPAIRMAPNGSSKQASLMIDPLLGIEVGDGANSGYSAQLSQATPQALDISFAQAVPPTSLAGTATTGGTLAANTYFYTVASTNTSSCTTESSPAKEISVVVGGANNAVNLTWTVPPNQINYIAGYCVKRGTAAGQENGGYFVSGAATAAFTDTGAATTIGGIPTAWNNTFASFHRFSLKKLGVNNTSPSADLDVIAQDAATVGFSVKAAASPTANLWQVLDSTSAVKAKVDSGFNFSTSGHINQAAANGDVAGTVTLAAGSATKTFSTAFASAPVCVGTDQTAANAVKISTTTSQATFTGTGTDVIAYICIGNPN